MQLALDAKEKGKFDQTSYDPTTGNYNQFWMADRDWDNRTALIIDPPNGQYPPFTPAGMKRAAALAAAVGAVRERSARPCRRPRRSAAERALHHLWRAARVCRLQRYKQIVQSPETVVSCRR